MNRKTKFCSLAAVLALAAGCSGSPESPLSPTGASPSSLAANPDGSTLKVTAPVAQSPAGGERVNSQRPTFTFRNSTTVNSISQAALSYRVEVRNEDGSLVGEQMVGQSGGDTTSMDAGADLELGKNYIWRVRGELEGAVGPWSAAATFNTPPASAATSSGGFGPQRTISLGEAFQIILKVHNDLRYDLGSRSSREQRINFLFSAVAAIHYGHARFNPAGGDRGWCVKDAGGGRPPSDDVLVRCDTAEAWDLIGGAGANGYSFHLDYLGSIRGQNIYPPPVGALGALNR